MRDDFHSVFAGGGAAASLVDRTSSRRRFKSASQWPDADHQPGVTQRLAFPLIAAGLAGGHWPAIAAIIERQSLNFTPVVYTTNGHPPPRGRAATAGS